MMSSEDESKEEVICPVCSRFESQAWRKKFCRNCFHSLDEHSEDGEKESAGHEKVENEKNLKNTDEKKDTEDKTDKISKDKLLKEDKNKTSKTSTDKSLPDKDKTASKQNEKTSALADKISKKLTGSTGTNITIDKKVEEKVKTSSTDNLKSKFESSKKTNEQQGDNIDSKKLDEKQSKLDGDKSKLWGGKAKGADTSDEKSKKDKEADKSDQKLNLKDKEMKSDLKDKLDNVKSKSDFDKTKPLDAKSKFESKSHGSKEGTPSAEEKDGTTSNTSKKDDKQKQTEDEHMSSSKMFKLPEKTDTKMKWKDMWGSTLPSKTDEKTKVVDAKTEKTNDEDDEEITNNKDLIKAKFESKDTGNLWGVTKPTEKSGTSKLSPKETEKSISGDKVVHKEVEKSTADDKITPEEPAKSKFGDNIYSKELEKSKFGDKITPKEPEKSKFGDKITSKEPEKSKLGDKITSKEPEKSKFGDKITSKEPEKSKFDDKISSKEPEKSKFGDKITSKEPEKSKFGDKITSKVSEKSKFGDKITSKEPEKSKFGDKISSKEPEKSKFGDKITSKEPEKSKFGDKITSKEPEKSKFGDKITSKVPEKSKFGDKITSKETEKSKFGDKITSKESEKSKFGDKIISKEPEKSKFGDKITSKEPEKSKFGDKITSKEPEKSKFGDKITSKEPEKSKFGNKITSKEPEKSKFGDKITSKEPEKSKFGDKITSKEPEKSKFDEKITSKEPEKSKFGDQVNTKDNEKSKFGDKINPKEHEKHKFGDSKTNINSSDGKGTSTDNEKSKTNEAKQKLDKLKNIKSEEKTKLEESKSKIDTKNDLFGSKSKFDKNDKFSDLKSNKNFGVELKGKNDDKKKAGYLDQKSDIENQKNEKLEGKLKLDIKKTENSSKSEKDSSSVSHSLADRLKDKYEKISKTSTPNTPSKTNDIKTYGRSKSDGSIINDQPPDKKSAIASPEIKSQPSTGNTQHKLSSQTMTDDKKQELLDEEKAKSPRNKPTQYEEGELPGMVNEVKEDETTPSSESLPKLNTDDINKIKEAAKFLLIDDDFDDVRYNSLGRRNSGNKSTPSQQATSSLSSSATLQADDGTASIGTGSHDKHSVQGTTIISNTNLGKEKHDVENIFNEKFNSETERLKKQLKQMEERCSELEEENKNLKNGLLENEKHSGRLMKQKQDVENSIKVLQRSLTSIESKCFKLETENSNLIERIKIAQAKCDGNTAMELKEAHIDELKHLQERLAMGENIVEELRDDNDNLKQEILDLKGEMEEMYDTFRDQEAEEFRDVQREMEMHAKNCRVLSFKLRKYERLNDQLEAEKENCEDKLRMLQNQISDGDTRAHIRDIEDELRLAKEVSVRLHDELDILEEKKCKSEDENHQLTQILEQSDKKQFRLEMEVDKLRDQISDYKKKVAEKSTPGTPVSQDDSKDRRSLFGRIGQQGSQEQDISQLTRDLYDSMERETDLKDQLKFAEEEIKDLRKKRDEVEEENENLSVQLKKMSASKVTKYKENKQSEDNDFTETEIELKVQLELNEQELMVAKRKIQDLENENEKLLQQSKLIKEDLAFKEQQLLIPQPPLSPNTYYEDKIKELNFESDELKWKIIEKDREIEKLSTEVSLAQTRQIKMRKSRSLETDYYDNYSERKKHLDLDLTENVDFRDKIISEVRGSPEQLVYRKLLTTSSESLESSSSPEDGNFSSGVIPTQFYSRSRPNESFNASNQSVSREGLEQLKSLQRRIDSLQQKINALEIENSHLKKTLAPVPEVVEGETREDLMEKILDMEEDIDILTTNLKKKDVEITTLQTNVTSLKKALDNTETVFRRKELELLRDLDIAQEKNDILSNLLDIVKERADTTQAELERLLEERKSSSVTSENSARTVSVLSDVSFGSDEVFAEGASRENSAPGSPESSGRREKRIVIQKDWESQFRKRVHCLERILAEERQKLAATEKKLALVSTETLSTAMSDDAKLHEREKEILQGELQETKKHLRIASDQIIGLKERILSLEDENNKLHNAYWNNQPGSDDEDRTPSGSVDTVLSLGTPSGSIDTVLSVGSDDKTGERNHSDEFIDKMDDNDDMTRDKEEIEYFRQRVTSLEARLEESNDIWKSKSCATEKEKLEMEEELTKMTQLYNDIQQAMEDYKTREEKSVKLNKEYAISIKEKVSVIERKDEIIQEHEDIIKQREDDLQQLLDQISQRDSSIRELRDSLRNRDERLKEKDEILQNMNLGTDEKQEEINYLTSEMSDSESQIKEKDEKIKNLEEKVEKYEKKNKDSNVQIENDRLNRELEDMAFSIGKVHTDNNTLQVEMEKTKQALSEAMVLWNKDRSTLGQELTVAREKVAMFEACLDKKENQTAQLLRKEAHKYLEQKEKLQHELRVSKVEHDANMRTLKIEKQKLQDELTQTIRQLTSEMSNNDKMSADLERLKCQEDIAYQIQHHEKVLRAEYMAMKVRFETRLENLQKEHTRLLTILDQMQHEKVLNQEIIKGVQKQMSLMKENYHKNLEKTKQQHDMLERHIKELEDARDLAMDLQLKVDALKRQLEDQEYERAELVDKITAERSAWDLAKSNKQSKINQLEERLAMINNAQSRTKDMQTRMEVAWNRERSEQKRLLTEAHYLAIDLQKQLKYRDDEHLQEKRVLLDQLKRLRNQLDEEQISRREQLSKQGTRDEQLSELERKLKDVQDKTEKEHTMSLKDQADLVRRLGDMRRQHKRDQRRMEDVLCGLTRLRELASIVVASENNGEISDNELEQRLENLETCHDYGAAAAEGTKHHGDIKERINEVVLKYIKEALKEIYFAAENIARPREISDEERKQLRRSLSSSELDSLKDDFVLETLGSKELEFLKQKYGSSTPENQIRYQRSVSGTDVKEGPDEILPSIHMGSVADRKQNIMSKVHKEQGLTTKFPDPPPSFLLPRCINPTKTTFSTSQTVRTYSRETTTSVRQIPKSISIDTSLIASNNASPLSSCSSAPHSPLSLKSSPCNFKQVLTPIPVTHVVPTLSASVETVTPKTARKLFFEDGSSDPTSHRPWPTRSRSHDSVSKKEKEAIVNDIIILEKDDNDTEDASNLDEYVTLKTTSDSNIPSTDEDTLSSLKESKSDKKKRKTTKRSISLDSSSVKSTLAKAGVSVMSPAAPSVLSPSEIFAAVKRKLKPNVKRSSSLTEKEVHSVIQVNGSKTSGTQSPSTTGNTQDTRNTFEPPLSGLPPKSILIPPPTPPISSMQRKVLPVISDNTAIQKRSREENKKDKNKKRPRSKSAERARTGPSSLEQPIVQQDIIPSSKLLGFETSV